MKPIFLICGLLLLNACGQKSDSPPSSTAPAPAPTSKSATGTAAAAAPEPETDNSKTIQRLTQAVRKYAAENRRVPKSLDELVSAGYLPEVPGDPGGKKYIIDDQLRVTVK